VTTRPIHLLLASEAVVLAALAVVALDLVAHRKVERLGGVNVWGQRGPVLHRKQPREIRIAVTGGDLAFGWGVAANEALAPTIRQFVALETDKPGHPLRPVTAVTAAAMGLSVHEYAGWISRLGPLNPDVVCIVLDPARGGRSRDWPLPDRRSLAWRLFGYAPILPLVVQEKGTTARSRVLQALSSAAAAIDRGIAGLLTRLSSAASGLDGEIDADTYARSVEAAVRSAESIAAGVVVVSPPYAGEQDVPYHLAVRRVIETKFSGNRRVHLVDLGDEPDMYDDGLRLNDLDFSTAGHARVAIKVTPVVLSLVSAQ
jgi:hypothetical protein